MRQTHIPGPVTRALTLVLAIQVTWAGPQLDQIAGKRGITGIHSFTNQIYSLTSIKSFLLLIYSLLIALY